MKTRSYIVAIFGCVLLAAGCDRIRDRMSLSKYPAPAADTMIEWMEGEEVPDRRMGGVPRDIYKIRKDRVLDLRVERIVYEEPRQMYQAYVVFGFRKPGGTNTVKGIVKYRTVDPGNGQLVADFIDFVPTFVGDEYGRKGR